MDAQDENDDNNNDMRSSSSSSSSPPKMHSCDVRVTFPTNRQAQYALQVLQVDKEPTGRVTKSMEIELHENQEDEDKDRDKDKEGDSNKIAVLKVHFESSELKMLRVSVSSFYDYLALVVKTFQEFDR